MEIRQIEYFLKVAECGGISQAAEALGISQPHLSRQIRALEQEWGWALFQRSGRGVRLTPKGEVSLREMQRVQRVLHSALRNMQRENGVQHLRIGYAPSLTSRFLHQVLDRYRQQFPETQLSLHDASSREMQEGITNGTLDLILGAEFPTDDISWTPLFTYDHLIVCRADHPLATAANLTPTDLDQQRLLLFSRHDYPAYWDKLLAYFAQHGINAKIAGEFDGIESLLTAIKAGLGIALLTTSSRSQLSAHQLTGLTLTPPIPPQQVSIGVPAYQATDSPTADFLAICSALVGPEA